MPPAALRVLRHRTSLRELARAFYAGEISRDRLAAFAPVVHREHARADARLSCARSPLSRRARLPTLRDGACARTRLRSRSIRVHRRLDADAWFSERVAAVHSAALARRTTCRIVEPAYDAGRGRAAARLSRGGRAHCGDTRDERARTAARRLDRFRARHGPARRSTIPYVIAAMARAAARRTARPRCASPGVENLTGGASARRRADRRIDQAQRMPVSSRTSRRRSTKSNEFVACGARDRRLRRDGRDRGRAAATRRTDRRGHSRGRAPRDGRLRDAPPTRSARAPPGPTSSRRRSAAIHDGNARSFLARTRSRARTARARRLRDLRRRRSSPGAGARCLRRRRRRRRRRNGDHQRRLARPGVCRQRRVTKK